MVRGHQGHGPDAPALKKKPAEHEGRRRRAGGATGRRKRGHDCQSLLTLLTRGLFSGLSQGGAARAAQGMSTIEFR